MTILVDFWQMVLFQADTYRKNATSLKGRFIKKSPLEKQHFETWLTHFKTTVDALFEGETALMAKERATSIATVVQMKIAQLK